MNKAASLPRPTLPARTAGFTLLEMLVVLVLMGLLTALVAQALGGLAAIDNSLERAEQRLRQDYLAEHQLRELVGGLVPDPALDHDFAGNARSFAGLSLGSLAARPGVPLPVQVRIESGADGPQLVMAGGASDAPTEQRWALGPGDWGWRYLDPAGQWRPTWPEERVTTVFQPQLPRAVALVETTDDTPRWLLAVAADPRPRREYWPVD